jgi:hypothetical protein
LIERNAGGDLERLLAAGTRAVCELGLWQVRAAVPDRVVSLASGATTDGSTGIVVQRKPKDAAPTRADGVREVVCRISVEVGIARDLAANICVVVAVTVIATLLKCYATPLCSR